MILFKLLSKLFGTKNSIRPNGTYKVAGLSKDQKDDRDILCGVQSVGSALPRRIRIQHNIPVRNQLELQSCASHATSRAMEIWLSTKDPRKYLELSELFHYYQARVINNTMPEDKGMTIRDACKTAHQEGVAPEYAWPYVTTKLNKYPSLLARIAAKWFKPKVYERLITIDQVKVSLYQGIPVVIGIPITTPYYSIRDFTPYKPQGKSLGGHAVLIEGYDDDDETFIISNSWGPTWGRGGYFKMKYSDFKTYAFDYWRLVF